MFFRRMMDALSEQTDQNYEHILVDSDSKDGTADLLAEYTKSGHIDTLISEKDHNLHEALNKGLALARGEYVYVMNTDNYFTTPKFFERSLAVLNKHDDLDFTHADRMIMRRDGGPSTVKKGDLHVAFFRMPFRWQTMIIRKKIYDRFGPLDERFKIAADYKFMLKMIMAGVKGHYFPEVFINSLDGGITQDRQKCINEVSCVLYECYGKKFGLDLKDCEAIYRKVITPDLYKKLLEKIKDEQIIKSLTYCYEHERATV